MKKLLKFDKIDEHMKGERERELFLLLFFWPYCHSSRRDLPLHLRHLHLLLQEKGERSGTFIKWKKLLILEFNVKIWFHTLSLSRKKQKVFKNTKKELLLIASRKKDWPSAVASWYCWYSDTRSFMFDSASVNSISSMPSPVYQWRKALRRNMAVNCSEMRLNKLWMAVEFPGQMSPKRRS